MPGVTSLNNALRTPDRGPGQYNSGVVTLTASATLDHSHNGKTVVLNAAAGLTVTLPTSSGNGWKCKIIVLTTVTSNSDIVKVGNTTDALVGFSNVISDDAGGPAKGFIASAGSDDTITLNGTTTGGYAGDTIYVEDIASGTFAVEVIGKATGTEATPFSATV